MLKAFGVLLLWGGCALWGMRAAAVLRHRVRVLEDVGQGLELMERELALNRTALPELLEHVSHRATEQGKMLFVCCHQGIEKGKSFTESWNEALERGGLMIRDRELLAGLSSVLGRYDATGQLQALSQLRRGLDEHITLTRQQAQSLGKVYGVLGMTAGGFLSLMLM